MLEMFLKLFLSPQMPTETFVCLFQLDTKKLRSMFVARL